MRIFSASIEASRSFTTSFTEHSAERSEAGSAVASHLPAVRVGSEPLPNRSLAGMSRMGGFQAYKPTRERLLPAEPPSPNDPARGAEQIE